MYRRPDVVDMHCDTISRLWGCRNRRPPWRPEDGTEPQSLRKNNGHIDLLRLKEQGYLLQNFALFVHLGEAENPWERVLELCDLYQQELDANQDIIAPVFRYEDIEKNQSAGKISALLTVEEGGVCEGKLGRLHTLYEKGVRMLTLTWNFPNELGYPNLSIQRTDSRGTTDIQNTPDTEHGLTPTGLAFVEEMEALGMIPDVSHLSDAGFYDVLKATRKPFVASHSNARAVCPHARNLTDEMIRALADRGGVMGLNFCAAFLTPKPFGTLNPGTIEDIVHHAKHITKVGGIEVLGLGSDFDGIPTNAELQGAQDMERLYDGLLRGGFTSEQADKIFSKNVLRLYRDTLV